VDTLSNPNLIDVTAAILTRNGQVLIAKRKPGSSLPNKWEFPGGKVEDGETPEECLRRELDEEFGIEVSIGEPLGESVYHYDHISIRLLAYRTFWNGGDIFPRAHSEIAWAPLNHLIDYDFAPADLPFVQRLRRGEIEL
jgi:8-oxo-dGTP diphosphatase